MRRYQARAQGQLERTQGRLLACRQFHARHLLSFVHVISEILMLLKLRHVLD